jgi:hypothetical protein
VGAGLIVVSDLSSQLMAATFGQAPIPSPLAREIFLLDTRIAGVWYENRREAAEKLPVGCRLTLIRRPDNTHDGLAIEIHAPGGELLGYVPRDDNPIPARLMDAGKLLFAQLSSRAPDWEIKLVLQEL